MQEMQQMGGAPAELTQQGQGASSTKTAAAKTAGRTQMGGETEGQAARQQETQFRDWASI
jgi:hypothetical protein